MAGSALRRLMVMSQDPPDGIAAVSIMENKFFEWEAAIIIEDDVFIAKLEFSQDYPLPPQPLQDEVSVQHVPQ